MGHIQYGFRETSFCRPYFKSSRPACVANSLLNMLGRNAKPKTIKLLRSRNGQSKIAQLVTSGQREVHHDLFSHHGKWKVVPSNHRWSGNRGLTRIGREGW